MLCCSWFTTWLQPHRNLKPNQRNIFIGSKSADVNIINISYNAGFKENNGNTYPSFINGLAILSNKDFVENIKVTYVNTNWR